MDLDLGCVASFLVLAEETHVGRAAAHLHVTPSALTKRMQRLERQVGVRLLTRDSQGRPVLTAAGERFAVEAEPLLAAARAARAIARGERVPPAVRLGVVGAVGEFPSANCLRQVGRELRLAHPGVRLVCVPVPVVAVHSCLLEGMVDVMWGTAPTAPLAIEISPLVELERRGVVPASHPLADAGQVLATDFAELPLVNNFSVPVEWVAPLVLADVRSVKEARLVPINSATARGVFTEVLRGRGVTTTA